MVYCYLRSWTGFKRAEDRAWRSMGGRGPSLFFGGGGGKGEGGGGGLLLLLPGELVCSIQ